MTPAAMNSIRRWEGGGANASARSPNPAPTTAALLLVTARLSPGRKGADALPCFDHNGLGALLVAARSIIYAFDREPYKSRFAADRFDAAARQATADILRELRNAGYPLG